MRTFKTSLLLLCLAAVLPLPAATAQVATTADSVNVKSFDKVWDTIKQRHWDEDLVGEKWDKAKEELRPKVVAAKDTAAARAVILELIGRLGQSHFAIVPSSAYKTLGSEAPARSDGYTGLVVRERDNKLIVSQIKKNSPASKSDIKPGWSLDTFGKRSAKELLDAATQATKTGPMSRATLVGVMTNRLLRGATGSKTTLSLTDLDGKPQQVELEFSKAPGKRIKAGNMPTMQVAIESEMLPNNVGYLTFTSFFDPVTLIQTYDKLLEKSKGGIIIDVRGNVGGLMSLPTAMGSRLVGEAAELGTMKMKGAKLKLALNAWSEPYDKPVAVLIDECSISSAEILSGGLKDLKLARVCGTRTAGLALPSTFEKLPNGDGFQYAFADYHSASGASLEKNGVTPDEEIPLTREAYKKHKDPVLARALEWISSETSK